MLCQHITHGPRVFHVPPRATKSACSTDHGTAENVISNPGLISLLVCACTRRRVGSTAVTIIISHAVTPVHQLCTARAKGEPLSSSAKLHAFEERPYLPFTLRPPLNVSFPFIPDEAARAGILTTSTHVHRLYITGTGFSEETSAIGTVMNRVFVGGREAEYVAYESSSTQVPSPCGRCHGVLPCSYPQLRFHALCHHSSKHPLHAQGSAQEGAGGGGGGGNTLQ